MFKNKTILVTGGAGFVGSHLSEEIYKSNGNVVIVDDLSNGSLENLNNIKSDIDFIKFDISDSISKLKEILKKYKFDGIFNLACFPRSLSLSNPIRDVDVNARATINILEIARENNSKVVFTSNSGIYGNPEYLPMDEKHPDKPSTPYDANKLVSEYYLKIYNKIYNLPVAICRLATVYGERQRTKSGWKPVIAEFITKVLRDEAPTIYWDGKQTRDLIYVKDVVQGLIKAYLHDTKDEVFILGTEIETSINEIYKIITKTLGKYIEPIRKERVPGDIARMKLSYDKANKWFNFKPEFDLKEGIKNYIDWLKCVG